MVEMFQDHFQSFEIVAQLLMNLHQHLRNTFSSLSFEIDCPVTVSMIVFSRCSMSIGYALSRSP